MLIIVPHDSFHREKVSLLKKAGSIVLEYFEWDLLKVLSQGGAELLKYTDSRRFS
jgi:hypothetical protein